MNILPIIDNLSRKRPLFHNEADFQHALAWEIREFYPDSKIRLEKKIQAFGQKMYLDIWIEYLGRKYAIELKYITRKFNCVIADEEYALSNHGAQDIGRYDVLKDLQRLEQMIMVGAADEGVLIFLTNDSSYFMEPKNVIFTIDQDFRIHTDRVINGRLQWGIHAGYGTTKGREKPIEIQGNYKIKWLPFSQIGETSIGGFRYLMLPAVVVQQLQTVDSEVTDPDLKAKNIEVVEKSIKNRTLSHRNPTWFDSFVKREAIPTSQVDLRDKLANHLREEGYTIQLNRLVGQAKLDIWAERADERIAIEVRYKTALLQTIHQGRHIQLKNQSAQDVSRYDFIADIGKIEKVIDHRPGTKGYVLLITNDHLYWAPPKKMNAVDEDFHIHEGHFSNGLLRWKDHASKGTTSGRETPIQLDKTYHFQWQPYLKLDVGKQGEFRALFIEVE